jgi:Fic family protein
MGSILNILATLMIEKHYKIGDSGTDLSKEDLQNLSAILSETPVVNALAKSREFYLSWDEFKRKDWATDDPAKVWSIIRFMRKFAGRELPVRDQSGQHYKFDPERHRRFLHEVDLELGGNMLGISDFSEGDKRQFIRRNLIEESFASSKLEGANTSRETARKMLTEGRRPNDRSEHMIVNNYAAMTWIEETGKNQKLSMEMLLDLHQKVTSGTLKSPEFEGRIRETLNDKGKRLVIKPWDDETIAYVTPDKEFVHAELQKLIEFANEDEGSTFIHPLIKAIVLHFWIGLLHPFEDGNGRLARILFYWQMLRKGYWAFSYLSLSERIMKSPKQYAMAFIYSEQDGCDLNYFIQYNIDKLKLAREQLRIFLKSRIAENKELVKITQMGLGINNRQTRLLQHLMQGELSHTSVAEHHNIYPDLGYVSAMTDLKTLVEKGYLRKQKNGRNVIYLPTDKIQTLFR